MPVASRATNSPQHEIRQIAFIYPHCINRSTVWCIRQTLIIIKMYARRLRNNNSRKIMVEKKSNFIPIFKKHCRFAKTPNPDRFVTLLSLALSVSSNNAWQARFRKIPIFEKFGEIWSYIFGRAKITLPILNIPKYY